jgi:putative intracellular protease/amidase
MLRSRTVARVLIPIPAVDFDPSEVAVSWSVLTGRGHEVVFASPDGRPAQADPLMISGEQLDPWGQIPGLRRLTVVGRVLRADGRARGYYEQMQRSPEFTSPISWDQIEVTDYDGLLLPGGHRARGMRLYLESDVLQQQVVSAFDAEMPVAAICHGVLLAARSIDPGSGRSVLHGRRTTALTWQMERTAWRIARIARFWDPNYYRTYSEQPGQPTGYMSVQQEVTRALASPADFEDVPDGPGHRLKTDGRHRDTPDDERPAFVVIDGSYVSARWPGDAHTFAKRFSELLTTRALTDSAESEDRPQHETT